MKDTNSGSPQGEFDRRSVMKTLSGAVVASPAAFSSAAEAKEQSDPPQQQLSKTRRQATSAEANTLVDSDVFRDILKRMRIPTYDVSSAEVVEVYIGDAELTRSIELETKYGTVSAILDEGSPSSLTFIPGDDEIPRGLKKQYSGSASWEDNHKTFITIQDAGQPIVYTRETTAAEAARVSKTAEENGAHGEPVQTLITTTTSGSSGDRLKLKSDSEIWAVFEKLTFRFDYETADLLGRQKTEELFGIDDGGGGVSTQEVTCQDQAVSCGADLVTTFPNCVIASVGCSLSTVAAGGCLLIVLAICVPGGALSVYSCYTWCQNCTSSC